MAEMPGDEARFGPAVRPRGPTEEGELPGPEMLSHAAERALVFQNFLIRRAWGVYYAIWSAALVTFLVFPALVAAAYPTLSPPGEAAYYGLILLVVLLSVWATSWAFGQTFRALRLRRALRHESSRHWHLYLFLAVGVGLFALVFLVATLNSFAGLLFLDACLGVVNLWILLSVRDAFPRVPPEGSVAIGTYAVSIVGSATALVLTGNQSWFGGFWLVAIVGWAFAALYALYHAPEEMTRETGV
ncbi:MAG TPA: hypothetical protein VMG99_01160 [Thermoplasmata archaeon]|nr:hypothetical protein [Thermoplasmata archaeon]